MSQVRNRHPEPSADLLVVGGGVAGLFAALCAAAEGDVVLLAKGPLLASTSRSRAQGGIAAAVGADDSATLHAEDTLRTGRGLSRESAVTALAGEASARIRRTCR